MTDLDDEIAKLKTELSEKRRQRRAIKWREYSRVYNQRPDVKARNRAYAKRYYQRPGVRAKIKERDTIRYYSPVYQAWLRRRAELEGRMFIARAQRSINRRARAEEMATLYRTGAMLRQIGDKFGVSRERVRQIMTKELGLPASDGGQAIKAEARREDRKRTLDIRCQARSGCIVEQWRSIPARARRAFVSQKNAARHNKVEWSISMWDWWLIWSASGQWENRGRGKYVLSRLDRGRPWTVENVSIVPFRLVIASCGLGGIQAVT